MMNVKVLIDSVEKVKRFTSIISKENVDCELIEGVHIVDAKSIMGIFSMNLSQPIELKINSDNNGILEKIKEFVIQEG